MTIATTSRIPILNGQIGTWHWRIERDPIENEDIATLYDRLALQWPVISRRWGLPEAYQRLAQQLANADPSLLQQNTRVLECGVGSGALSLAIASASPEDLRHDLLDLSPEMLKLAGQILSNHGIIPVSTQGDIRSLPYADNTFDVVMAAHVVEHLPDPLLALRELHRVTKPKGHVLIIATRRSLVGRLLQLLWRVHCVTRTQMALWLLQCGFAQHRFFTLECGWRCTNSSIACMATKPSGPDDADDSTKYGPTCDNQSHIGTDERQSERIQCQT